jgi:hypothetical protein
VIWPRLSKIGPRLSKKSRLKKSRFFSQSLGKSPLTDQVLEKSLSFGKSLGKESWTKNTFSKTF